MAQPWFNNKGQAVQTGCAVIAAVCAVIQTAQKLGAGGGFGLWGSIALVALSVYALIAVFRSARQPSLTVRRAMYHPSDKNKPGKDVTILVRTLVKEPDPRFSVDEHIWRPIYE